MALPCASVVTLWGSPQWRESAAPIQLTPSAARSQGWPRSALIQGGSYAKSSTMKRRIVLLNLFTEGAHIRGLQRVTTQNDETMQAGERLLQRAPPGTDRAEPTHRASSSRPYLDPLRTKLDRGSLPADVDHHIGGRGRRRAAPSTLILADPMISIPPFEKSVVSHLRHLPGS